MLFVHKIPRHNQEQRSCPTRRNITTWHISNESRGYRRGEIKYQHTSLVPFFLDACPLLWVHRLAYPWSRDVPMWKGVWRHTLVQAIVHLFTEYIDFSKQLILVHKYNCSVDNISREDTSWITSDARWTGKGHKGIHFSDTAWNRYVCLFFYYAFS